MSFWDDVGFVSITQSRLSMVLSSRILNRSIHHMVFIRHLAESLAHGRSRKHLLEFGPRKTKINC